MSMPSSAANEQSTRQSTVSVACDGKRMRLTDISDLKSSLEDPTIFSIEPTQVYDVEHIDEDLVTGISCSSLSFGRIETQVDEERDERSINGGRVKRVRTSDDLENATDRNSRLSQTNESSASIVLGNIVTDIGNEQSILSSMPGRPSPVSRENATKSGANQTQNRLVSVENATPTVLKPTVKSSSNSSTSPGSVMAEAQKSRRSPLRRRIHTSNISLPTATPTPVVVREVFHTPRLSGGNAVLSTTQPCVDVADKDLELTAMAMTTTTPQSEEFVNGNMESKPPPLLSRASPRKVTHPSTLADIDTRHSNSRRVVRKKINDSASLPNSPPSNRLTFSRIFGLWKNDHSYYPGTIKSLCKNGTVKVEFDDKTKASLSYVDCRHCRLIPNDKVKLYSGITHEKNNEAQEYVVTAGVVDDNDDRHDPPRNAEAHDTFYTHQKQLTVKDIYIPNYSAHQLDDRKLTSADIASLEGRSLTVGKPSKLIGVKPEYPFSIEPKKTPSHGLFSNIGFLITSAARSPSVSKRGGVGDIDDEEERIALQRRIESNGGCILEPNHDLISYKGATGETIKTTIGYGHHLSTILLLSDQPATTPKYLIALSLSIPCVSREFVLDSLEAGRCLSWRPYLLPAGYIDSSNSSPIMGAQHRSISKDSFEWSSIRTACYQFSVFKTARILVVIETPATVAKKRGKGKTEMDAQIESIRLVFAAAGSSTCDFVYSKDLISSAECYDFVVLDAATAAAGELQPQQKRVVRPSIRQHRGVVSFEWVKKCIIWGSLRDVGALS